MKPLSFGTKIVIASHNEGKIREISDLLKPYNINVASAKNFNLHEPQETGTSFAENAALKADFVMKNTGRVALSDDSGLVVAALDGAPGIYSARWAETQGRRDFAAACLKVWQELQRVDTNDFRAAFVCALALASPDAKTKIFEGRVAGKIVWPPRGTNGFGYDPIFVPEGGAQTFGELAPVEKHKISHRALAFAQLLADIQ